jgi:tetratricopeptide (TPR) repeat protein
LLCGKRILKVSPVSAAVADSLFAATTTQAYKTDYLSGLALSRGIDAYLSGSYETSVREFKRAIGLSLYSENSYKAHDLLATTYIQLDKPDEAIATYKASIRLFQTSDEPHSKLGTIYFDQGKYDDAEAEYLASYRLNPSSITNLYSLGQAYIAKGRYDDASKMFNKIIQQSPQNHSGYYGLGQTYYKSGKYEDALEQFDKVLNIKQDFYSAHVDIGYTYADMGDLSKAREQAKILSDVDTDLANLLNTYIYKVSKPEFLAAYNLDGFNVSSGTGTAVSSLNDSLTTAGASQSFTMNFIFSKDMDVTSVQNPFNWQITKAAAGFPGGAYNWGLPAPSTDVGILPHPKSIYYDASKLTAVITFDINQNDTANGTIDPSHIIFAFYGLDAYGNAMSSDGDQYGGFSAIV